MIFTIQTLIFQNKLNLKNSEELQEIEKRLLQEAYEVFISELDENTTFDEKYFISLHQRTLDNLYDCWTL